jgi:hypothetical protein
MSTRPLPPPWNSQAIEDRPREVGLGHSTVDQVPDRHEVANGPVRHYDVTFWTQPPIRDGGEVDYDKVGWHEDMHESTNAPDVVEVVQWAEEEARKCLALYTIFPRMSFDKDSPGLVWLAGLDPTVHPKWNSETPGRSVTDGRWDAALPHA